MYELRQHRLDTEADLELGCREGAKHPPRPKKRVLEDESVIEQSTGP